MSCKATDGFFDHILNPNCGANVYDTCDKQTWINCRISQTKTGILVFICIMLIYSLYVYIAGADLTKLLTLIFAPIILTGAIVGSYFWAAKFAEYEWDQFEIRIAALMKNNNFTRPEAVARYIADEAQRKAVAAQVVRTAPTNINIGNTTVNRK